MYIQHLLLSHSVFIKPNNDNNSLFDFETPIANIKIKNLKTCKELAQKFGYDCKTIGKAFSCCLINRFLELHPTRKNNFEEQKKDYENFIEFLFTERYFNFLMLGYVFQFELSDDYVPKKIKPDIASVYNYLTTYTELTFFIEGCAPVKNVDNSLILLH